MFFSYTNPGEKDDVVTLPKLVFMLRTNTLVQC